MTGDLSFIDITRRGNHVPARLMCYHADLRMEFTESWMEFFSLA